MADAFFEVDEQLRAARLQSMFRRLWPYAAGVAVLAGLFALGVWAWRAYDLKAQGDASAAYGRAMTALSAGDAKGADAKLGAMVRDAPPSFKALALMQLAGEKLKADDASAAASLLDQAAATAHDKITVDAARLKAAYVLMDRAPYDQVRARLLPLADKARPYHSLAREALAMEELANGRAAEAKGDFQVLALSQDVSDATRTRANAALAMIGTGAAANLSAVAKGAVGLKPAPPPPQSQLSPEQAAALARIQAAQGQGQGGAGATSGAPQ